MKPTKRVAAVAAGGLLVAAMGAGFASPAHAASISNMNTFNAEPVNQAGVAAYNAGASTASLVATQAATSQDVNLAINMASGPLAGFAAVGAGSYQYEFDIIMDGAIVLSGDQCETNAALSPAVAMGASYAGIGGSSPIPTLNCTVPGVALGAHTFDIRNMNVNGNGAASGAGFVGRVGFDANANRSADPAEALTSPGYVPTSASANWGVTESITVTNLSLTVNSITGQLGGSTTHARTGNVINVTAGGFSAAGTLSLCNSAGTVCTDTGTFNGAGVGSLTVTAGATAQAGVIKATSGSETKTAPLTVLGARSFSLSPPGGTLPATVTASYQNLDPGEPYTLSSFAAYPAAGPPMSGSTSPTQTASATGAGTSAAYTVPSGAAAVYMAAPGFPVAWSTGIAWVTQPDTCTRQVGSNPPTLCETQQNITATVNAGALTQTASDFDGAGPYTSTLIPLGAVTTASTAGSLTGNINPITVADARGGALGWTLTASMPALTAGTGSIANGNLAIGGISCTGGSGSATGNTAGPGTTFAGTVTLCTKDTTANSAGGTSGGTYAINGSLNLTVPAFQAAGNYSSIITVTLA